MDTSGSPTRRGSRDGLVRRIGGRLSGRTARELAEDRDRLATRAAHLRKRVDKLERQRDKLRRRVARLDPPKDLEYLFVVTYGRSGSTLLQGVLNSIPGYVIRGENRQLLRHLFELHRTGVRIRKSQRRQLRDREGSPTATTPAAPFYGMEDFPKTATLPQIRKLAVDSVMRPPAGTRVTGYKEIRWDAEDVGEFIAWLREVFPGARFVINTRELTDVARSKWWAEDPESYDRLRATEERLLALLPELGDAAYHVRYDEYVADPGALEPLFAWLGEPYDADRVREVLAVRHSY